jgi:hypothetical protein
VCREPHNSNSVAIAIIYIETNSIIKVKEIKPLAPKLVFSAWHDHNFPGHQLFT